jgi:iron(III) transport system substrate-binding protein
VLPTIIAKTLVAAALLASAGCRDDKAPKVVLYASADEHLVRQVIDSFQKQTGIQVLLVGDTEVKKTAGLVERLRSEMDNPQADVFWSSEVFMTIGLADDNALESYESASTVNWPAIYGDPQHRWYGFAARARVIVYAPQRVDAGELPKTWMDLTSDRFRGRVVMADPRFGTTGGHLGAMKAYWDKAVMPGFYRAFIEGLAENRVRLLPSGNAGVVEAVIKGEADLGMTDTDDVWAAQAQGHQVKCIYPAHSADADAQQQTGGGTLLVPNTAALVRGGPNPEQARRLMDFLLSQEVERMLAESVSHNVPIVHGGQQGTGEFAVPDPLQIDYAAAASQRRAAVDLAMKLLGDAAADDAVEEEPNAR